MKGSLLYAIDDCTIIVDYGEESFTVDLTGHDHGLLMCSDGTVLEYRAHGVCDIMLRETGRYYDYTDYWTCEDDRSDCVHFTNKIEHVKFEPM